MSVYGWCEVCGKIMEDDCDPHTYGIHKDKECHAECCPICNDDAYMDEFIEKYRQKTILEEKQ